MTNLTEFIDYLKSRLVLSEIIGTRVKIMRKGRLKMGLCPFHSEKTPSFHIKDEQGTYHCFGCGAHGDALSFLQETEGVSFMEALEKLASLMGLTVPTFKDKSVSDESLQSKLFQALEAATVFFEKQLKTSKGFKAAQYLETRGLKPETISQFRLGYASVGNTLKEALIKEGFSEDILQRAGLIIQRDEDKSTYDRFRDRVMFPIFDRKGRVIAFGGRILEAGEPKYLNSPETSIFHKSQILYAYNFVQQDLKKGQPLLVAEGYLDVISLHQAGFKGAVAPLGTALTEEQILLLWRFRSEPILCFDGDSAGQKAAIRAAERAMPLLKFGLSLRFALLPKGEDPDSLLRSGGSKSFESTLERTLPLSDLLWQFEVQQKALKTPEQRAVFENGIMTYVNSIQEPTLRAQYRQEYRSRLRELFYMNSSKGANPSLKKVSLNAPSGAQSFLNSNILSQKILIAVLLNHPSLILEYAEDFVELELSDPGWNKLREAMLTKINDSTGLDAGVLHHHLYNEGFREVMQEILSSQVKSLAPFVKEESEINEAREGWTEIWSRIQGQKKLTQALLEVKRRFGEDMSYEAWDEVQNLQQ
ncbi:MAG: DNA primase [Caedibacter sp. 38-128]|nr:DNA primase [Holosporales bacterium]OJX04891.1 MAG: DNA primase [Caedibacter sp. 38-128]